MTDSSEYFPDARVVCPDFDTESSLTDGVVEYRRGDGAGDTVREGNSVEAGHGEDEGREGRGG